MMHVVDSILLLDVLDLTTIEGKAVSVLDVAHVLAGARHLPGVLGYEVRPVARLASSRNF